MADPVWRPEEHLGGEEDEVERLRTRLSSAEAVVEAAREAHEFLHDGQWVRDRDGFLTDQAIELRNRLRRALEAYEEGQDG